MYDVIKSTIVHFSGAHGGVRDVCGGFHAADGGLRGPDDCERVAHLSFCPAQPDECVRVAAEHMPMELSLVGMDIATVRMASMSRIMGF